MKFPKLILPLFFILVGIQNSGGQPKSIADSIIFHLKQIKIPGGKDSLHIKKAIYYFQQNPNIVLLQNYSIKNEFIRLRNVLDEEKYESMHLIFFESHINFSQPPNIDLIRYGKEYFEKNIDSANGFKYYALLRILRELRKPFRNSNEIYEGIKFFNKLEKKFAAKQDSNGLTIVYNVLSGFYKRLGLYEKAEYYMYKSIDFLDDKEDPDVNNPIHGLLGKFGKINRYSVLGSYYLEEGNPKLAEKQLHLAIKTFYSTENKKHIYDIPYMFLQMAKCKTQLGSDSSRFYFDLTQKFFLQYPGNVNIYAHLDMERGNDFLVKSQYDSAAYYVLKSKKLKDSLQLGIPSVNGELLPNYYLAKIKLNQRQPHKAIQLLAEEIGELKNSNHRHWLLRELRLLAEAYLVVGKEKDASSTFKEILAIVDQLNEEEKATKSISFEIEKKMQADDIQIAILHEQDISNKKASNYLSGISILLGLFAITLGIAIYNKQKSNSQLKAQNEKTQKAFDQLKATQTQLIQSEKMASLGELTAGIAHEIQNPLNFINNFSELNSELIAEMKEEMEKGNFGEVKNLANDLDENEQKILHHGKRADAIVKGMLQHSRSSSGKKEPTDINALADEYLRLAYHGLRARDKSFNAKMETSFDETIGNIDVIPQDIGRVILNLITNAFYAAPLPPEGGYKDPEYKHSPTVWIKTKRECDMVVISVRDNGPGIPPKIMDKIFQPFFTTKPTGQGTGLGLSLSYDIVKAHGGELKVDSKEGKGALFQVILPI